MPSLKSLELVWLMREAKSPDIPDGLIYEDEQIRVDKKDGKVLLTGKPIKNPFIYDGSSIPDGQPCGHPGCLNHISHPCEGCGRIGGMGEGTLVHEMVHLEQGNKYSCGIMGKRFNGRMRQLALIGCFDGIW